MEVMPLDPRDALRAAILIYSSGVEVYDYLYLTKRRAALDFIQFEAVSGNGLCGYRNVSGIYKEGRLIGTSCFVDEDRYNAISGQTLVNAMRFYSTSELIPMLVRFVKLGRLTPKPKSGEVYFSNFAIAGSERNKGYGSEALHRFMEVHKNSGYSTIGLDVLVDNERAKRLYERVGFVKRQEKILRTKRVGLQDLPVCKMELSIA